MPHATVRLVTWNVQWGLGMDGRRDFARIVDHARRLADFDVLCLQEVADNMPDLTGSAGENQFEEVAALLPGYRAIEGAALEIVEPDGARRRFGNLILTQLPVRQVMRHALPWPGGGEQSMPRMLLEMVVEAPFGPLRVLTTHLEYHSAEHRALQVEAIRAVHRLSCDREERPRRPGKGPYALQPNPRSAILTGDFNMCPDDPTKRRLSDPIEGAGPAFLDAWEVLNRGLAHPPSFCISDATYGPPHCCDYVFVTEDLGALLASMRYDVDTRLSDHQPVVLTLRGTAASADDPRLC